MKEKAAITLGQCLLLPLERTCRQSGLCFRCRQPLGGGGTQSQTAPGTQDLREVGKWGAEATTAFRAWFAEAQGPSCTLPTHLHLCTQLRTKPAWHCCHQLQFDTLAFSSTKTMPLRAITQRPLQPRRPAGCLAQGPLSQPTPSNPSLSEVQDRP